MLKFGEVITLWVDPEDDKILRWLTETGYQYRGFKGMRLKEDLIEELDKYLSIVGEGRGYILSKKAIKCVKSLKDPSISILRKQSDKRVEYEFKKI